jgi:hypothetical protein
MATATPHNTVKAAETPRPRGAARREALLEAVLTIVAEVGPDAVTHRRVAEVAGLPPSAPSPTATTAPRPIAAP